MSNNAKWSGYFKIVSPENISATQISDNQRVDGASYGNYSWYQMLMQGNGQRITRYREYDNMDTDVEVARALDIIAEEMTNNNTKTGLPLDIDIQAEEAERVSHTVVMTLRAAMRHWSDIHDFGNRLYNIARHSIKYGDCFFRKGKGDHRRWEYIPAKLVVGAVVDQDDVTKIYGWVVKTNAKSTKQSSTSGYQPVTTGESDSTGETVVVPSNEMVRFTLNDDMTDHAPFGVSVLAPVYRAFKQKELLEDSIVIYRIQRAPERRVFYIDVGKMPPHRTKQHLEQIKNEIRQKKIPSASGGGNTIDSTYNPQSMSEDFFFASRPDGKGSRVESLPGGQGLGELSDLEYFMDKVFRGLRVPISWMKSGGDGAIFSDGRVGTAYIEELRFATFVQRLQGRIEATLDAEFKKYLKAAGINIDPTIFKIKLPEPSNFGKYRQQELDTALLNAYSSADGVKTLSKRFSMSRYLQMSRDEISTNELLLAQEMGLDVKDEDFYAKLYNENYNEDAGMGSMGGLGDLGGGDMGDMGGDPELGGMPGEGDIDAEGLPGDEPIDALNDDGGVPPSSQGAKPDKPK